jgi:isoamylase
VCYAHKHNEANPGGDQDGTDENYSTNCGVEGPSDDLAIEAIRTSLVKNLLAITLISMGVPMIGMGDEVRRTQLGNNNPYCQDNEISWFDWSLTERYAGIRRFVRGLIDARLELDMTRVIHGLSLREFLTRSSVEFHGVRLHQPDWSEDSYTLAVTFRSVIGTRMVHVILNSYERPLDFELTRSPGQRCRGGASPTRPSIPRRRRRPRQRTTSPRRQLPGRRPLGGSAVCQPPRRHRRPGRPLTPVASAAPPA